MKRHTLVRSLLALLLSAATSTVAPLAAAVLHDNGPFITHPGGGAGGADASRLQTDTLGMIFLGYPPVGYWLAEEFTVPALGWNVGSTTFFCFQSGSTTTSTVTSVRVQIWNGDPRLSGSAVVFGDLTTNRLAVSGFSGVYRDSEISPGSAANPIMEVTATIGTTLSAGTYWIQFQASGSLAGGVFCVPLTIVGQATTGNALQLVAALWNEVTDFGTGTPQGIAFRIDGEMAPVELLDFGVE